MDSCNILMQMSLESLGEKAVDIFYLHAPDHDTNILETLQAVHECFQKVLLVPERVHSFADMLIFSKTI